MTVRIRRSDRTGRIDLRGFVEPHKFYRAEQGDDGTVILHPLANERDEHGEEKAR